MPTQHLKGQRVKVRASKAHCFDFGDYRLRVRHREIQEILREIPREDHQVRLHVAGDSS